MTPEHRKRLLWWGKTALMVAMFGVMFGAVDRLLNAYSYDDIAAALTKASPSLVVAAIGVLVLQEAFLVVREWLSVSYAKRTDVGLKRIALASVVARSLSTLGFSSITGVGLRMHIYNGWGVTAENVAEISIYDNAVFVVGIASQFAFTFTFLPIPARLEHVLGVAGVRLLGLLGVALVGVYALWSRRGHTLHIRKFVIEVPTLSELAGQVFLPIIDLALTAWIVQLCLPGGLGLTIFDVMIVCLIASVASSVTQVPAGLGMLEGMMLWFVNQPDVAPAVIAGLFVRRVITNLLPIAIGAILLVILEVRRHPVVTRPSFLSELTATMLAALTFVFGAVVMVVSASPYGDRLGNAGQILAVIAGSGLLFVARGLERRTKIAWQIAIGLLAVRAVAGFALQPATYVIVSIVVVGGLLAMSRSVFTVQTHPLDGSPRWWIASATVVAATMWIAFVDNGHEVTPRVYEEVGAMLGVAAIAIATAVTGVIRHRKLRAAQAAPG